MNLRLSLTAFALIALTPGFSNGSEQTAHDRLVAVIASVSTPKDPIDPDMFASAVEAATKDPDWRALLISVAAHESALSLHVIESRCEKWECDPLKHRDGTVEFRAAGAFQTHRNLNNAATWGSLDINTQALEAYRMLTSGYWVCSRGIRVDRRNRELVIKLAIDGYAGVRCGSEWPGGQARVAAWRAIRRRL